MQRLIASGAFGIARSADQLHLDVTGQPSEWRQEL